MKKVREFTPDEFITGITWWIKQWFDKNGKDCKAVVGISGGKDSAVVAALCVRALGKDRVIGVKMPNRVQSDIEDANKLIDFLGIQEFTINIHGAYTSIKNQLAIFNKTKPSEQAGINLAPRLRMAALYFVSQTVNGRVANTCNLSEDYIGFSTRWGDDVGDFCPLKGFTSDEVIKIGHALGLPAELVDKAPSDGLSGKLDEEIFGFTYKDLNEFITTGRCKDKEIEEAIRKRHLKNSFKMKMPEWFDFDWYWLNKENIVS